MSTDRFEYPPGAPIPGTNYRVVRRIGAGGMGVVYEVEDVSIEKRYVLKTIQARLAGRDDAVERFIREAKALAKLDHKNIVQVITAGVTGDSMALRYFVMEKLTGHSLRTVLDNKQRLELEAACRTVIELMGALDKAHEHGIVHRDIKPENIFLHRDSNGVTTLKLLDFGIMTSADARTVDRKGFVGTVRYAAPEQIRGDEVSPLSDLYAATLVLYECIAGRGPFDEVVDFNQLVAAHMTRPAPRISLFRPDVPRALEDLVARGLAKNPAERPPDAFTFAAELNRLRRSMHEGVPSPTAISTVHDLLADPASAASVPTAPSTARDVSPPLATPITPGGPGDARAAAASIDPRAMPTRAEGELVGLTTPAPQAPRAQAAQAAQASPHGHGAPSGPGQGLRADQVIGGLGGATVAEEAPVMTLGPEAVAAGRPPGAIAPHAQGAGAAFDPSAAGFGAARSPAKAGAAGAPAIDRSAPTGTYLPPTGTRSGSAGDTLHMSPLEQRNLHPVVPGAPLKTARMEPVPEAFGATTEPPEGSHVTSANTSQSIGDPILVRGASKGVWLAVGGAVLLAAGAAGIFAFVKLHGGAATPHDVSDPAASIASTAPTSATSASADPAVRQPGAPSGIDSAAATTGSAAPATASAAEPATSASAAGTSSTSLASAPSPKSERPTRHATKKDSELLETHRSATPSSGATTTPTARATAAPGLHMPGSGL